MAREQAPTKLTTLDEIMSRPAFVLGVHELRAGLPLRDLRSRSDQWSYERGRAWAAVAPKTMPLRRNGKLNPAAVKVAQDVLL
jgi:hypothetical protein